MSENQTQLNQQSPPSSGSKIVEPSTITFEADTIFIGTENLCLGFKEEKVPFNMEKINTLVFKMGDKIYTYKKES